MMDDPSVMAPPIVSLCFASAPLSPRSSLWLLPSPRAALLYCTSVSDKPTWLHGQEMELRIAYIYACLGAGLRVPTHHQGSVLQPPLTHTPFLLSLGRPADKITRGGD